MKEKLQDSRSEAPCDSKGLPVLWDDPNKYAPPAQIEWRDDRALVRGYQEYTLARDSLHVSARDSKLKRKQKLLAPYFTPRYLSHRTVLDLGAAGGFFSFWSLQRGAEKAIALDIDHTYLQMLREARDKFGLGNLEIIESNFSDWTQPADITLALALVHWVYSCTAFFGSLSSVLQRLAELTGYMLIVEWIEPTDAAIEFFHHIDWNKERSSGDYDFGAFEKALGRHFSRYEVVGDISTTRRLYVAFRTPNEIDLSGPLPLIMAREAIIYSKRITSFDGLDYWSRIYDMGDRYYKQTTSDLAEREAHFLGQLDSGFFPRAYTVQSKGAFSVVALEGVHGMPLLEARDDVASSPARLYAFIDDCLNLLGELRSNGIIHRDIRPDNVLVRSGRPVLLDFSWATSDAMPCFTPRGLGSSERPPDGSFCDVYSMGKVLEQVNQQRYHEFDLVIELMVDPDASFRITDLNTLKMLFTTAMAALEQKRYG